MIDLVAQTTQPTGGGYSGWWAVAAGILGAYVLLSNSIEKAGKQYGWIKPHLTPHKVGRTIRRLLLILNAAILFYVSYGLRRRVGFWVNVWVWLILAMYADIWFTIFLKISFRFRRARDRVRYNQMRRMVIQFGGTGLPRLRTRRMNSFFLNEQFELTYIDLKRPPELGQAAGMAAVMFTLCQTQSKFNREAVLRRRYWRRVSSLRWYLFICLGLVIYGACS